MQNFAIFLNKTLNINLKTQNNTNLGTIVIIHVNTVHSICKQSIPKEIPTDSHNRSNYDGHVTIKKLAEEFDGQFTCLGEY